MPWLSQAETKAEEERATALNIHRLQQHRKAIDDAEKAYVASAPVEQRVTREYERQVGRKEFKHRRPIVKRTPHTMRIRFWSDEKPVGLTLELVQSKHLASKQYLRIVNVSPMVWLQCYCCYGQHFI